MFEWFRAIHMVAVAASLSLISSCGLSESKGVYEQELLAADCALVEQMDIVGSFMSDEYFSVGVRCGQGEQEYSEILSTGLSDGYGLVLEGDGPDTKNITVFFCDAGRDQVVRNISGLNENTGRTGFHFALSPVTANCTSQFAGKANSLTHLHYK